MKKAEKDYKSMRNITTDIFLRMKKKEVRT